VFVVCNRKDELEEENNGFAVASMVVFVQMFPLDELVAVEVEGFDSGFSFTALSLPLLLLW
jgi:hypothetical protein